MSYLTDDILSARYKLAQYYEINFTEISLYSLQERNEKVPLPKLYMAMKWMEHDQHAQSKLTDYTEVFKMVSIIVPNLYIDFIFRFFGKKVNKNVSILWNCNF